LKIILKTKEEIAKIRVAGSILAACHKELAKRIKPGVTTMELDTFVEEFLKQHGATPEQKGYRGFPYATCASVNEVVCHGFPKNEPLRDGDIVTIDIVVNKDGWLADSGWSYRVGKVSAEADSLLKITEQALYEGIKQAVPGNRIGDIGAAVFNVAKQAGVGVVRSLIGHGIGQSMHEQPDVPNFGRAGTGVKLKEGMVITIEPIFTRGDTGAVHWGLDGWTISSADGSLGAHYEHTLAITEDGPIILTN
jgi:methionyl aminopeptidase